MSGHGWVIMNDNGLKARCGGPAICKECQKEQVWLERSAKDKINDIDRVGKDGLYAEVPKKKD